MMGAWLRRRRLGPEPGTAGRPFGIDAGVMVPRAQLVDEVRQLDEEAEALEDALDRIRDVIDDTARELGHAHPVVRRVRAILDRVAP